ncbi:hypothetical protein MBRA1_001318 [Malassezia brasiliensis]|uniref:Sugar phosphate transporter domain-containing protein n=1 Tax=Malassezia brasiliensis TaxID=1821822 RepID=A0AAF0DS29_9BASI|nr:hypothetical protein MBRA1_001318 [Malassezia brasiliensis]
MGGARGAHTAAPHTHLHSTASTVLLVGLCLLWYLSSALSSNTSKGLLSKHKLSTGERSPALFPYPVTLTLIQFVFVNAYCYLGTRRHLLGEYTLSRRLVRMTPQQLREVGQISVFNVVGHALSSLAISRVPVSMVHTIKALSPLFTVLSYAYLFHVSYSLRTYVSLIPLMVGVVLACSSLSSSADDLVGFAAALGSTFIFVAQNIYSKKLLKPTSSVSTAAPEKLDKINILFYSSVCSVVLMLPMCIYYDVPRMMQSDAPRIGGRALYLLWANGGVHFAQNLLAFQVLAHVSPVTYSIANLFKRVFVILLAIVWFGQHVTYVQWTGIFLTFLGLYLYNQSKNDAQTQRSAPGHETEALPMHHRSPLRPATKPTPPGPRARPRPANLSHAVATPLFSLPPQ